MLINIKDVQFLRWDTTKAETLRGLRKAGTISRRALGDKILKQGGNCSHENIRNLEKDNFQQYVGIESLISLCEALEVPLSRFVKVVDHNIGKKTE